MEAAAGFPRYDQYKDSGVEWIGEVPSDWKVLPFKALFRMSTQKNGKDVVGDMLSVSGYRGIEVKHYEHEEQKRAEEDLAEYRVVRKGQLVVNTMWLNYAGLGVSEHEGHVSPAYRSYFISEPLYSRYAHYLLRSHIYVEGYTGQMQGIRPNSLQIKNSDFSKLPVLIPRIDEQQRIANFLDQKTAEIDAAIAQKQRLIELLKEQKAILINQAVTQGLDPNVPMYDSGVEWIGQVPEHWEVLQNRRGLRKIEQGSSPSLNNDIQDDTYSVLKLSAVKSGIYIDHEYKPIPKKFFRRAYQVKKGDFLMTRGNTPELVADICYVKDDPVGQVMMPDLVYRLEYDESIFDKEFVAYFFQSKPAREQIKLSARGSSPTMVKVSQDHIKSWLVPVPPLVEQRRIRTYLDKAVAEIGAPIEQTNQQIQMLGELKSVLISEAVTGKIKL
tara:strand:+ start:1623 stop:2948 length:1326 start_codon:yes stop_codon:yes gene_type:complete